MKYGIKKPKSQIVMNDSYEAESIEEKIRKIVANNEPIDEVVPMIYQEEKDGVQPAYDIRSDRWEIAQEAMNKIEASNTAKRDEKPDTKSERQEEQ